MPDPHHSGNLCPKPSTQTSKAASPRDVALLHPRQDDGLPRWPRPYIFVSLLTLVKDISGERIIIAGPVRSGGRAGVGACRFSSKRATRAYRRNSRGRRPVAEILTVEVQEIEGDERQPGRCSHDRRAKLAKGDATDLIEPIISPSMIAERQARARRLANICQSRHGRAR